MKKYIVIVRHGPSNGDENCGLSDDGRQQIKSLRATVEAFIEKSFGLEVRPSRLCFSFSYYKRAVESAEILNVYGDMLTLRLYRTERKEINGAQVLHKVLGISGIYDAQIITIVAHGLMPSVVAEAAHEFVTGAKLENQLPYPDNAHGYVVDMHTGDVTAIGPDGLKLQGS